MLAILLMVMASPIANLIMALPMSDSDRKYRTSINLSYLGENVFGRPDNETGTRLATNWKEDMNPEEMGEYIEGDILFPEISRNGLIGETYRWKDGVVPYEIAHSFTLDDQQQIKRAMDIYHKYTCISFRHKTSADKDYVSIVNGPSGCWSSVGRTGGRQEINLQSPYCTTKVGTSMHELMHALGFLHEQNRFERDDFVSIAWQNIKKGHDNNFNKADKDKTDGFGVPYDYRSVMHYSKNAFSNNGKPTIIPKDVSKAEKMGQRDGFSKGDITKLNKMYGCPKKNPGDGEKETKTEAPSGGGRPGGLFSFLFNLH